MKILIPSSKLEHLRMLLELAESANKGSKSPHEYRGLILDSKRKDFNRYYLLKV